MSLLTYDDMSEARDPGEPYWTASLDDPRTRLALAAVTITRNCGCSRDGDDRFYYDAYEAICEEIEPFLLRGGFCEYSAEELLCAFGEWASDIEDDIDRGKSHLNIDFLPIPESGPSPEAKLEAGLTALREYLPHLLDDEAIWYFKQIFNPKCYDSKGKNKRDKAQDALLQDRDAQRHLFHHVLHEKMLALYGITFEFTDDSDIDRRVEERLSNVPGWVGKEVRDEKRAELFCYYFVMRQHMDLYRRDPEAPWNKYPALPTARHLAEALTGITDSERPAAAAEFLRPIRGDLTARYDAETAEKWSRLIMERAGA